MDSVARYLCEDTALVSLVLSRNRIGEQGAISLSEGLKVQCSDCLHPTAFLNLPSIC